MSFPFIQLFWTLCIGAAVYAMVVLILGARAQENDRVAARLDEVGELNSFRALSPTRRRSLVERLFNPLAERLSSLIGKAIPINEAQITDLNSKLRISGSNLDARRYLGRTAALMVLVGAALAVFGLMAGGVGMAIQYGLFGVFAAFVLARFSLASRVTKRKEAIEADMPDVLDLLSSSVSAGLGFDQALGHVIERTDGPFTEELALVQRDISLGRMRAEALNDMAKRCEVEPLTSFVNALNQADKLGIPIANVLLTQAESIRLYRKQRVEEKAAKLPVKILLPLVGFIFPSILVVLLGPAVLSIIAAFS